MARIEKHDFKAEEARRTRTRFARMYLTNYIIHGAPHELEKAMSYLQRELEFRLEQLKEEEDS